MAEFYSNELELVLASKSPRRQELIKAIGLPYQIVELDVEEVYPSDLPVQNVPEYLARLKADAYKETLTNQVLITADTVVVFEQEILGKPKSQEDAIATLKRLSGKVHQVITGVCLRFEDRVESFSSLTDVELYELTQEQIMFYVSNYEVLDKAGSYAIQEWIGKIGVKKIAGDFYNVIGLPIAEIFQRLPL